MINNKGMTNMNENPNENENQTQTKETAVENRIKETTPIVSENIEQSTVVPKVEEKVEVLQPVNEVKEKVTPETATSSTSPTPTTPMGEPVALQTSATTTQSSSNVSNVAGVNPILKETSKVSFGTKKVEEEPKKETTGYSPMEEKRKTKSKIPLIIFFIFLFAFVFFLPNINDYFKEQEGKKKIEEFDRKLREEEEKQKKEEEEARKEQEKKEQEEQQYETVTCVSAPVTVANTTTIMTRNFTHAKDKLKSVKISTNIQYLAIDDTYTVKKTACESKTIAAASLTGYEFSCSIAELEIEESNNFDLKEFKTQKLINSDGTEETIETEYKYDSSVKEIREALTAQGYTCQ